MEAWETLPSGSTATRICTSKWPRMAPRIFAGMSGRAWWVTNPWTTPPWEGSAAGAGAGSVVGAGDGAGIVAAGVAGAAVGSGAGGCGAGAATGARDGAGIVAAGGAGAALSSVTGGGGAGAGVDGVKFQPNLNAANMSNRTRTAPAAILARNV